jgi:hypothetical protein
MLTNVSRVVVAMSMMGGMPAWAQTPPAAPDAPPALVAPAVPAAPIAPARPADRGELRHQIYVMEGALARAVEFGAQKLNRELRTVVPEMFLLAGNAQARGVYLDGYGIFFDVAVPMLRQSMMWSLRMMLQRDDTGTRDAVAELRRHIQSETNPSARQSLESAIARLEAQASPLAGLGRPAPTGFTAQPSSDTGAGVRPSIMLPDPISGGQGVPPPAGVPTVPTDMPWLMDTNRVYTEAVQRALIDAMIDFSAPMRIAAEEWLTVAARDNEQRDSLAPQDPYEEVVTVLLRIRGADLLEYRAGRIDKDEARKRVVVGEF